MRIERNAVNAKAYLDNCFAVNMYERICWCRYNVQAPRAVSGSNQLVEIGMVTAPGRGTVFPCVNWAGGAIEGFALTVHHELECPLR